MVSNFLRNAGPWEFVYSVLDPGLGYAIVHKYHEYPEGIGIATKAPVQV